MPGENDVMLGRLPKNRSPLTYITRRSGSTQHINDCKTSTDSNFDGHRRKNLSECHHNRQLMSKDTGRSCSTTIEKVNGPLISMRREHIWPKTSHWDGLLVSKGRKFKKAWLIDIYLLIKPVQGASRRQTALSWHVFCCETQFPLSKLQAKKFLWEVQRPS